MSIHLNKLSIDQASIFPDSIFFTAVYMPTDSVFLL